MKLSYFPSVFDASSFNTKYQMSHSLIQFLYAAS